MSIQKYILPQNHGLSKSSRDFRKSVVATVHSQLRNSVNSSPYPVFFYRINRHGELCSCDGEERRSNLGDDGGLRPDIIQSILESGEGIDEVRATVSELPEKQDIFDENPIFVIDGHDSNEDVISTVEDSVTFLDDDTNTVDFDGLDVLGSISMAKAVSCPICMGSNFADGLSLINGKRIVLHAGNVEDFTEGRILSSTYPSELEILPTGSVTFKVILPKSGIRGDSIHVWNDKVKLPVDIIDVATGKRLSKNNLASLCDGKEHTLEIPNTTNDDLIFTHAEIQISFNDVPLMANLGSLPDPEEVSLLSVPLTTPVTLEYPIKAKKGDLMVDGIYNKVWVIQSVTTNSDSDGNIFNVSMEARVVQEFEVFDQLPRPVVREKGCKVSM